MGNDFGETPSSASDSGLSSALSPSCDQQLSPSLTIEDDQVEIVNSNLDSPHMMEFDPLDSPNQSIDSSVRSVMSSSIGSPETDIIDEMDFEPSLMTVVDPNVVEGTTEEATIVSTMEQQPIIECGKVH